MRLTALTLTNYGPFRDVRFGLDPKPGRINLLVAPNGFGKSVLRHAFCDLLFGITPKTDMGFRFGFDGMRLMAEAIGPDGAFIFGRRKGMGNTLIDADSSKLEPATLARLLGGTDRALLERLFALDTERLRAGGAALLASGGSVADALLAAAGGLRQARQARAALETGRDALAPLQARNKSAPFSLALKTFLDAGNRIKSTVLRPEAREEQERKLKNRQEELEGHKKQAKAASIWITQLERVRRVTKPLGQHDAAAAWLAAHPEAPTLPAEIGARLSQVAEALHRADLRVAWEQQAVEKATGRAEDVVCDDKLLDRSERIEALVTRAGSAEQAAHDIPKCEGELAFKEQDIANLLHQLGVSLPVARAAEAIPRTALVADARRMFNEHQTLQAELQRLPGELDKATQGMSKTEALLAGLPPARDLFVAVREVKHVQRGGDPGESASKAAQAVNLREASLAAALARIPQWRDTFAGVPAQPLLTYERLDEDRRSAVGLLQREADSLDDLQQQAETAAAQLAKLAAAGALPDAATIAAARARRERGWCLIYRRAFTPAPPEAAEDTAWAGEVPLPLAYERAVTDADALADARNRESDRLAEHAGISRRLVGLREKIAAAEPQHLGATRNHESAMTAWAQALHPLGLAPATTLGELRVLLAARDKAIEGLRELDTARADQALLQQRQAAAAARLAEALGLAEPGADLSALLARAEQEIEAARKTDEERVRLRERHDDYASKATETQSTLSDKQTRMAELMQDWAKLRAALGRAADEAPATTVALLEQFASLHTATQAAEQLRQRLVDMRGSVAALTADAATLAAEVAPDLTAADAMATVNGLRRRLVAQRALATQRSELLAQAGRAATSLVEAEDARSTADMELRAVLAVVGADSVAAAEPLVTLAAERAAAAATLHDTAMELAREGVGHPLPALRDEVGRFETDSIPGEIEAANKAHDAAWQAVEFLTAQIATETAAMQTQAAETATLQAEGDRQAAIATIGRVLEEALVLQVAAIVLEQALAVVDTAGTSALLARIGGMFAALTGGAWPRLVVEDDGDGGARLLAVERAFPETPKPVSALSDGTRDQLFLALRLAAIEDHVAGAPPLPFLADDILQTFDDARSLAAMRALVDLSAHVQVILLSHHPHLAELGRTLGPEQVHVCGTSAGGKDLAAATEA